MADLFGLDFGTTNTLASQVAVSDDAPELIDYLDGDAPHPSVVAFYGDRVLVGREAYASLETAASGWSATTRCVRPSHTSDPVSVSRRGGSRAPHASSPRTL